MSILERLEQDGRNNTLEDDEGRRYRIVGDNGEEHHLWSVTTILGIKNKNYYRKSDREAVARFALSDDWGDWPALSEPELVQWVADEPQRRMRAAGDRGTEVHAHMERLARGEPVSEVFKFVSPTAKPYVEAGLKFLDEWQPEFKSVETTCYSLTHTYAGTKDATVYIPSLGIDGVMDWKTGSSVTADVGLQLVAYDRAEFTLDQQGNRVPLTPTGNGLVVHLRLKPGGEPAYSLRHIALDDNLWVDFRAARRLFLFDKERSKGLLSRNLPAPKRAAE